MNEAESEYGAAPLFARLGGAAAIDRLVEGFYRRMDEAPEAQAIRAMHTRNLGPVKATLKDYLCDWTGGPKLYSPTKGHPRLRQRHIGFPIDEAARDAWLLCMRGALAEAVADEAARRELDGKFAGLADWMRNQGDNPHDARKRAAS